MHFNAHLQCKWVSNNSCLSAEQKPKVSTRKSFFSLNRWSAVPSASASAGKSVPDWLWEREGWDTGPQACCFGKGGKLETGSFLSQIKFLVYVQLPGKMSSVGHFEVEKTCCLLNHQRSTHRFYSVQWSCRHLSWIGARDQGSYKPMGPWALISFLSVGSQWIGPSLMGNPWWNPFPISSDVFCYPLNHISWWVGEKNHCGFYFTKGFIKSLFCNREWMDSAQLLSHTWKSPQSDYANTESHTYMCTSLLFSWLSADTEPCNTLPLPSWIPRAQQRARRCCNLAPVRLVPTLKLSALLSDLSVLSN